MTFLNNSKPGNFASKIPQRLTRPPTFWRGSFITHGDSAEESGKPVCRNRCRIRRSRRAGSQGQGQRSDATAVGRAGVSGRSGRLTPACLPDTAVSCARRLSSFPPWAGGASPRFSALSHTNPEAGSAGRSFVPRGLVPPIWELGQEPAGLSRWVPRMAPTCWRPEAELPCL